MRLKRLFSLFLFFLFASGMIPAAGPAAHAEAGKSLTLMVYMCGSNLESCNGAATADLLEMAGSGYDFRNVNLLVMAGGTSQWKLGLPTDALCIYRPGRGQLVMLSAFEDMSMGEADALTLLLDYGYECFPAQEYALILWDHGGGPLNGVCWDERYGGDRLTMEELCRALGQSPAAERRLSWIGFDACLMASAEVGNLMAPYAKYMIASQETEPGTGWDYSFLRDIHPDTDGAATGRCIVDSYFGGTDDQAGLTLSVTDLDMLPDLTARVDELFSGMEISGGNYARYSYAARQTRAYGKAAAEGTGYDLIDLDALLRELSPSDPDAAAAAEEALEKAVIYSRSGDGLSGGLSVYHPYDNKSDYVGAWADLYPLVGFSEEYDAYVERFASYLFGRQAVSWNGLQTLPGKEENILALPLSEDQLSMTAEAAVDLLRWDTDSQSYAPAGTVTGLVLREGVLYACLPGNVLRLSEAGEEGGAIPYMLTGENRLGVYVNYCAGGAENSGEAVRIIPVDTSAERRSRAFTFSTESAPKQQEGSVTSSGSSTAETWTAETVSLNDAYGFQTGGTVSLTAPETAATLQAVSVPMDVAEIFGQMSTAAGLTGSAFSVPPQGQFSDITPVPMAEKPGGSIRYTGSPVTLDSFVSIEIKTFDPSVTVIDLSGWQVHGGGAAGEQVIHAWIEFSVGNDGKISELQTWVHDEEKDLWRRGSRPDEGKYPFSVFPVTWMHPVADADGGLRGTDAWSPVRQDAAERVKGPWSLEFAPWEGERLCAAFCLTDTQNLRHESLPLLVNP